MNFALDVVLAVAMPFGFSACTPRIEDKPSDVPVEVHCAMPTYDSVDDTVTLRGRTAPPPGGDLSVASQVAGRVVQVVAHEGDSIARGDVLASIEDSSSRDAVRQAEALLVQARAAEVNAGLTFSRTQALVNRGIASKQELDDVSARSEAAKAGTASAAAFVDLAQRTLGRVTVRSSFGGTVTRIFRGAGALVDGTPSTPILQLASASGVEFLADATDRELFAIREGQDVQITLMTTTLPIRGTVRAMSTALDSVSGLGFVRIALAKAPAKAPMGSFGRAVVSLAHRERVVTIPVSALRGARNDGSEVALCKEGKAELRGVHIGFRDATRIEVTDGLRPDERVAIDRVLALETGTLLREVQ